MERLKAGMESSQDTKFGAQLSGEHPVMLARFFMAVGLGIWGSQLHAGAAVPEWLFFGLAALATLLVWRLPMSTGLSVSSTRSDGETSNGTGEAPPELSALNSLPIPVLIVGSDARILTANKAAEMELGETSSGMSLFLRFRMSEMRQAYQSAQSSGKPTHFEMHEKVPIERWMRVDICPLDHSHSAESKCAVLFRDISEGQKLDRIRSDFVANASHELRTPLSSITGFIETLKGPAKDDEKARARFLGIMQEQADRMARLIDDLLSLSRLEMRSMSESAAPLDMAVVTKQAVDALQQLAEENGVRIELVIQPGAHAILGISDEIIQMIENLVENACKYGKAGKLVRVEIASAKGEVSFSVRDFGPGIAPEHIPRLTERFYRANDKSSPMAKGTGLGLAIVKHIVTRHRGRLSISSKLGRGSVFSVFLPSVVVELDRFS